MGIRALYPDWYFVDPSIKDSSILYSSFTDSQQLITKFASDSSLVAVAKQKALTNAKNLSLEPLSKKLHEFLIQEICNDLEQRVS